jgi:hypothetical protein
LIFKTVGRVPARGFSPPFSASQRDAYYRTLPKTRLIFPINAAGSTLGKPIGAFAEGTAIAERMLRTGHPIALYDGE